MAEESKKAKTSVGTLNYFKLRGRGEPIRLILAANDALWEEENSFPKDAAGSDKLPFGQLPTWAEGDRVLAQMDCICRHLGRKFGWYGRSADEDARIDELLGGVESLRSVYADLIYNSAFDKEALEKYQELHAYEAGKTKRNSGAHLGYLEAYLARHSAKWAAGGATPSIADAAVFDIFDLHVNLFKKNGLTFPLEKHFPHLMKHHEHFTHLGGVKEYLAGPHRFEKVNGNDRS